MLEYVPYFRDKIFAVHVERPLVDSGELVDALLDRGYCFVTVEQLMALRGVEPQAGELYTALPPEEEG